MQFRRDAGMSLVSYICWIDDFFIFFHLLSTCATPLSIFSISVMLHGLLGTPSNLELRNVEKWGVARLAFNDIGLAGLVGDVDAGHARDATKNGLHRPSLGKSPKRLGSKSLRRPCGIVAPPWGSWSQKKGTHYTLLLNFSLFLSNGQSFFIWPVLLQLKHVGLNLPYFKNFLNFLESIAISSSSSSESSISEDVWKASTFFFD